MTPKRAIASLLLTACLIGAPMSAARAAPGSATQDIQMAADSAPFRQAADEFVARSMAGDVDATRSLLSRRLVDRIGDAAARTALQSQILPFFQRGRQPGGPVTITQTTDAAGQPGYAFYMWMQYADAPTARPFTVYVVKEHGRLVVANIVPDRLVEGRHR
ncbi:MULTISPECIES: hypothetical protein [unclassified Roseateles]|uniref:hypothetical protein n=1 Tax=unclassified Roseateles TaxID=2626991 RepID=UPI0006F42192|nr:MULTISPECIES: hypothetical protein [unclassified Roseateles]KQW46392.1 hypothetical protein ASC81_08260 [Pelomonas sp. Root405]KRA73442.1 hypothetical protein ASD88_08260 [Pelomonas sp. Root662]